MAQEVGNVDSEKMTDTSSLDSSIPPPANQETIAANIQQSKVEADEDLTHTKTNQSEAEPEYPTRKKLIPSVIALYLAFFLVALVCCTSLNTPLEVMADQSLGPHNHRNRYTYNHR